MPIAGCVLAATARDGKMHAMSVSITRTSGVSQQFFAFATSAARDQFMRDFQRAQECVAAVDNARATCVFVSGVRGSGSCGNGLYRPTSETNDFRVLYVKEGDDDWWLEHYRDAWMLKQKEHKGSSLSWAYVSGGCALEDCGSRVWMVALSKGSPFANDQNNRIAVGDDAVVASEAKARMVRSMIYLRYVVLYTRVVFRLRASAMMPKRYSRNGAPGSSP